MDQLTTSAGISTISIIVANLFIWYTSDITSWTPRKRASLGILATLIVFITASYLVPGEWAYGPSAIETLAGAIITVLAAAGAPVIKDVIAHPEGRTIAGKGLREANHAKVWKIWID